MAGACAGAFGARLMVLVVPLRVIRTGSSWGRAAANRSSWVRLKLPPMRRRATAASRTTKPVSP